MFDTICIRRQELEITKDPIDIVFLAEAMLFYRRVHLIADIQMISYLVREMGPTLLLEFMREGFLQISYVRKYPAIAHRSGRAGSIFFEPVTADSTNGEWRLEKLAPVVFSKAGSAPGYSRQLGRAFADLVPTVDLGSSLINATKADFAEAAYVEAAVEHLLKILVPDYRVPSDYHFHLTPYNYGLRAGFQVETNVDFTEANGRYNQRIGLQGDTINIPALLVYMFEARCDLHFAAQDNAELATNEGKSAIIGAKFAEILTARTKSQHNIESFQQMVLVNSHEIGESLKYRFRTWNEFLVLLKAARKDRFKQWLGERDPDAPLIHEYVKAITADTWVASTPAKVLKFILFQGAGILISALGLPGVASIALSGLDPISDKLAQGWKPSQFVNGPLKRDFARMD